MGMGSRAKNKETHLALAEQLRKGGKMPNAKIQVANPIHRFFILGDTGSGKSTQLLSLPGKKFAYLFDPNALLSLRGADVDYEEFLPDRINLNIKSLSSKVPGDNVTHHKNTLYLDWQKDFEGKLDSGFFNAYDVIAFDSATTFLDVVMDRILTINGRAGQWPQQDDYGPQMIAFTNVVRTLMSMGKTIYMTGHLEMRQDELTKRIYRQPMLTGRLRAKIPLLFSDVLVSNVSTDSKGSVQYQLQTVPDRINTTIRTSLRGMETFEDVTLDFGKPLEGQGLGRLVMEDSKR